MFSALQKSIFASRDVSAVENAFSRLPTHWLENTWLGKNRYAKDCINRLEADLGPGHRVSHKHLSEYIAASAVTHCLDGWAYFGRALNALLSGDHNCARHLGYYSELRSAMSFLAASGIGVFSFKHIVVKKSGRCGHFGNIGGTHSFVWEALAEWASSPTSSTDLHNLVIGGGQSLSSWLGHFGSTPAVHRELAKAWLLTWGLDISRLAHDRNARNIASYRPTAFSSSRSADVKTVINVIHKIWEACEPTGHNPFPNIDRQLVRAAIRKAFTVAYGRSPKQAKKQYKSRILFLIHRVGPSDGANWEEFLLQDIEDGPEDILELAAGKADPTNPQHSLQVLCRSLLLLRLATGRAKNLLETLPGGSLSHLDFWTEEIGIDCGLWSPTSKPSQLADLWADVELAIEDLLTNMMHINSFNELNSLYPSQVSIVSSSKRAGLWSLGL